MQRKRSEINISGSSSQGKGQNLPRHHPAVGARATANHLCALEPRTSSDQNSHMSECLLPLIHSTSTYAEVIQKNQITSAMQRLRCLMVVVLDDHSIWFIAKEITLEPFSDLRNLGLLHRRNLKLGTSAELCKQRA